MANHKLHIDPKGRICARCGHFKSWDQYHSCKNGPNGHASSCKSCKTAAQRATYATSIVTNLRNSCRALGVEADAVISAFLTHDGRCDICRRTAEEAEMRCKRLQIDHDHVSGKFRGFLCTRCNVRLASLEMTHWTEPAFRYLRKTGTLTE